MGADVSDQLPPGFQLDTAPPAGLPPGFVLDQPGSDKEPMSLGARTWSDLKNLGSGAVEGVAYGAGMIGDVDRLMGAGMDKLHDKVFGARSPEDQAKFEARRETTRMLPTSSQIMGAIKNETGFEPAAEQTPEAPYLKAIGQFAPFALTGPGGVARKALQTVIPAVASEGTGQLLDMGGYHKLAPWGRAVAGLLGAGTMGALEGAAARAKAMGAIPSADEIKAAAKALYARADQAGLRLSQNSFAKAVDDVSLVAQKAGINPIIHPKAHAALTQLENAYGATPSLSDVDTLRRILGAAGQAIEPADSFMARIMRDKLDDHLDKLTPADAIAGDPNVGIPALTGARALWKQQSKAETIGDLFERAQNAAGANYTQAGMETALRQKFRQLADNKNKFRKFNPDEQAAILKVVRGGTLENTLRLFGKFAPHGLLSTVLGSGAGAAIGAHFGETTAGAVAVPMAGEAARRAASAMTQRNAQNVDALIRAGGTVPKNANVNIPATALTRGLIGGVLPQFIPDDVPIGGP